LRFFITSAQKFIEPTKSKNLIEKLVNGKRNLNAFDKPRPSG